MADMAAEARASGLKRELQSLDGAFEQAGKSKKAAGDGLLDLPAGLISAKVHMGGYFEVFSSFCVDLPPPQ